MDDEHLEENGDDELPEEDVPIMSMPPMDPEDHVHVEPPLWMLTEAEQQVDDDE